MSQKNNLFIFHFSLLNEWFGLSWAGRQKKSNNLPKSTYRRKKQSLVTTILSESQELITSKPVTLLWMDNFCEVYSKGYGFQSLSGSWFHGTNFNF